MESEIVEVTRMKDALPHLAAGKVVTLYLTDARQAAVINAMGRLEDEARLDVAEDGRLYILLQLRLYKDDLATGDQP
jgi:hypothetical protein